MITVLVAVALGLSFVLGYRHGARCAKLEMIRMLSARLGEADDEEGE